MNIIEELIGLISDKFLSIKTLFSIGKLEMRLACLSIFPLVVTILLVFCILLSTWILLLFAIGYGAQLYFANLPLSLGVLALVNILCLLVALRYLSANLKKMSFQKTRDLIHRVSTGDESYEKTIDSKDSDKGKNISLSSS